MQKHKAQYWKPRLSYDTNKITSLTICGEQIINFIFKGIYVCVDHLSWIWEQ